MSLLSLFKHHLLVATLISELRFGVMLAEMLQQTLKVRLA